jgi:hypothetical protein
MDAQIYFPLSNAVQPISQTEKKRKETPDPFSPRQTNAPRLNHSSTWPTTLAPQNQIRPQGSPTLLPPTSQIPLEGIIGFHSSESFAVHASVNQQIFRTDLFKLKEQPHDTQRKSYKKENRCVLPNPFEICLRDESKIPNFLKCRVSVRLGKSIILLKRHSRRRRRRTFRIETNVPFSSRLPARSKYLRS